MNTIIQMSKIETPESAIFRKAMEGVYYSLQEMCHEYQAGRVSQTAVVTMAEIFSTLSQATEESLVVLEVR